MRTFRSMLALFAMLAATASSAATNTAIVGNVFPPPGGHTFTNSGFFPAQAGNTFTISVPLASVTPVYFGPQTSVGGSPYWGISLSYDGLGAVNRLTFQAAESTLGAGIATWRGSTSLCGSPIQLRFTMHASVPMVLATSVGIDGNAGAVIPIGAGQTVQVTNIVEASYDGSGWYDFLLIYNSAQSPFCQGFGTQADYWYGYYFRNTTPVVSDIQNIVLNPGATSAAIPFTVTDPEMAYEASSSVTASSSNPLVVSNANIVLGGAGANRTIRTTLNGPGTTTITVSASDGYAAGTDTFTVTSNTAPTITNMLDGVAQKNTATAPIAFTVGDAQTGAATLVVTATSSNTTVIPDANLVLGGSGASRSLVITPATGEIGASVITVTATDPGGLFVSDTFIMTVNAPPRFTTNTGTSVPQGGIVAITSGMMRAVDDDGTDGQITFTLDAAMGVPHQGLLKRNGVTLANGSTFTQQDIDDGLIAYTHDNSCNTSDTFSFGASDSRLGVMADGAFTSFTFHVNATLNNLPPVANGQSLTVPLGAASNGTLTATNTDCITPTYSFSIAAQPTKGTLSNLNAATGAFTYTATLGESGADSFTFNVSDGVLGSTSAGTVSLTLANTQPTAASQNLSALEDGPAVTGNVSATDPDLPPQTLTYRIGTSATAGTATVSSAGAFSYAPTGGRMGTDTFTVIANDGTTDSAPVTFNVATRPKVLKGRYVVSNATPAAVLVFNPANGDTGKLADLPAGDGHGVADGASGVFAVSDAGTLFRIANGTASNVASVSAPPFGPIGLVAEANGNLVVGAAGNGVARYDANGAALTGYAGGNLLLSVAIAVGPGGDIWVTDAGSFSPPNHNKLIRIAIADGTQTLVASEGSLDLGLPTGVAVDANGDAYVGMSAPNLGAGGAILKVTSAGTVTTLATDGLLNAPTGIAFDVTGNLVVANAFNGDLVTIDKTTGAQSILRAGGGLLVKAWDVQLVAAKLPGAPTGVAATAGNAQATVSFSAPDSDGGDAISSYTATCATVQASGASSPIAVTGLTNGTAYTCTVTATNSAGAGPASIASNSVTPRTVPGAPTSVSAVTGNASATVSFISPISDGGAAITSYTVTSSPFNFTATGAGSPIVIGGLGNGVPYTFTVTATNAAGTGAASAPSNSITPRTVPGAPTGVSATAGNASATVAFTAPNPNGAAITSFTVTSSPSGLTASGASSPITVNGLANGTPYTFAVTATNAAGTGSASTASNSVTPRTVPGAPTGVSAAAGDAQATVSFTAPQSNGAAITSYTVVSSPSGISASGGGSPITVAGLANGTAYTFTVTATNAAGAGPASASSNSVTPQGAVAATAKAQDFNGDGKSDILYNNAATGQVYRMLMNGFTITSGTMAYTEPNTAWSIIADGDANHDGVADLLWRNTSSGQVFEMPFGSNGLPNGGAIIYTEPNAAWKIILRPDLNGDGNADLLWWNSSTGQVYGMLQSGTSTIGASFIYTEPNTQWRIVAVGDFAGSGKQNQLVYRNTATGQIYLMTVSFSAGAFSQTGAMIYQEPNTAWKVIGAPDLNGDGKSDLLWRNESTGQLYGMLMNGTTIATQGMIYQEPNTAWKIVAFGDYNGDGKADLLWRNDTTGQVYMMLMNGLAISNAAMVYQEANTAWKILGPWVYGNATGILPSEAPPADEEAKSMLTGTPLNAGRIKGDLLNASPGLYGEPVNRDAGLNRAH